MWKWKVLYGGNLIGISKLAKLHPKSLAGVSLQLRCVEGVKMR